MDACFCQNAAYFDYYRTQYGKETRQCWSTNKSGFQLNSFLMFSTQSIWSSVMIFAGSLKTCGLLFASEWDGHCVKLRQDGCGAHSSLNWALSERHMWGIFLLPVAILQKGFMEYELHSKSWMNTMQLTLWWVKLFLPSLLCWFWMVDWCDCRQEKPHKYTFLILLCSVLFVEWRRIVFLFYPQENAGFVSEMLWWW